MNSPIQKTILFPKPLYTITFKNNIFNFSKYLNINFYLKQTFGPLDLEQSFELLYLTLPLFDVQYLPSCLNSKKSITFKAQNFQFEKNYSYSNLRSETIEVPIDFGKLISIHSEQKYSDESEYYLIYNFEANHQVLLTYEEADENLNNDLINDTIKSINVSLHYLYDVFKETLTFENAELHLFEDNNSITFEGKLILESEE